MLTVYITNGSLVSGEPGMNFGWGTVAVLYDSRTCTCISHFLTVADVGSARRAKISVNFMQCKGTSHKETSQNSMMILNVIPQVQNINM